MLCLALPEPGIDTRYLPKPHTYGNYKENRIDLDLTWNLTWTLSLTKKLCHCLLPCCLHRPGRDISISFSRNWCFLFREFPLLASQPRPRRDDQDVWHGQFHLIISVPQIKSTNTCRLQIRKERLLFDNIFVHFYSNPIKWIACLKLIIGERWTIRYTQIQYLLI